MLPEQIVVVVQSLSHVCIFATPWSAAHQASLPFTISRSLPKLMSIELVMPSNHLILCHPLFLLPSVFPIIRVFSRYNELYLVVKVLELQQQLPKGHFGFGVFSPLGNPAMGLIQTVETGIDGSGVECNSHFMIQCSDFI